MEVHERVQSRDALDAILAEIQLGEARQGQQARADIDDTIGLEAEFAQMRQ